MSAAQKPAVHVSTQNRSRITNDPRHLAGIDGRSPGGRRRRDLVTSFINALGGSSRVTGVQLTDIRRAAELTALAEETRAKALREGTSAVDISSMVRLEGMASRAVKALGIKPGGEAAPPMSLDEYLAAKQAEKAAREPEPAESS